MADLPAAERAKLSKALDSAAHPPVAPPPPPAPKSDAPAGEDSSKFKSLLADGSGCTIPQAERRAITLKQLLAVQQYISSRCGPDHWLDNRTEARLQPRDVNLYHLNLNMILPATRARQCSFVELIAFGPQAPLWFVSHWWGEPVWDFVLCIKQHSHDRELKADAGYWVCAYANNQWNAAADVGENPLQSSFMRAMREAVGVVHVLDKGAVCYTRVWCIFEVWVALVQFPEEGRRDFKYDMYAAHTKKHMVGITDGVAEVDGDDYRKATRERDFPTGMGDLALKVKVVEAKASEELDRCRILNCILGAETMEMLDCDPPASHDKFDRLDRDLHARFALTLYRHALVRGLDAAPFLAALRHSGLRGFKLQLLGCPMDDTAVEKLAEALPPAATEIDLGLREVKMTDAGLAALAGGVQAGWKSLKLNLHKCEVGDAGCIALSDALRRAEGLEVVDLDIGFTGIGLPGLRRLMDALKSLRQLKKFYMYVLGARGIAKGSQEAPECQEMLAAAAKALHESGVRGVEDLGSRAKGNLSGMIFASMPGSNY